MKDPSVVNNALCLLLVVYGFLFAYEREKYIVLRW